MRFLEISLRTSKTLGVGANSFSIDTGCNIGLFSQELSFAKSLLLIFESHFNIRDKVFPCVTVDLSTNKKKTLY